MSFALNHIFYIDIYHIQLLNKIYAIAANLINIKIPMVISNANPISGWLLLKTGKSGLLLNCDSKFVFMYYDFLAPFY
jgi:hypothetical protein